MMAAAPYPGVERRKLKVASILFLFIWVAAGCATYQNRLETARSQMQSGQFKEAAETLKPLALQPGVDQLVYLLDWGMSLYLAGEYKEAVEAFMAADQLVDFNDYLSLSNETASLLLGQERVQYKGTSYEKLLINVYLGLCFFKMNDLEGAAVEMRKLRLRLRQLAERGEKDYNRSFLALYLSAMVWEMTGEWDSAVIDYEAAYKIYPGLSVLRHDLVRANYRAQRMERYRELKSKWNVPFEPSDLKTQGQLVVLLDQGWISRLQQSPANYRIPELYRVPSAIRGIKVTLLAPEYQLEGASELMFDLDEMAHKYYADIITPLILKRLAAIAAKAVVADQVRQKNETLGDITWLALNLADRADVRQWSTLPQTFQILRVNLPPGTYKVTLKALSTYGEHSLSGLPSEITIDPGKISFHTLRVF
jgi:hypothetical protein